MRGGNTGFSSSFGRRNTFKSAAVLIGKPNLSVGPRYSFGTGSDFAASSGVSRCASIRSYTLSNILSNSTFSSSVKLCFGWSRIGASRQRKNGGCEVGPFMLVVQLNNNVIPRRTIARCFAAAALPSQSNPGNISAVLSVVPTSSLPLNRSGGLICVVADGICAIAIEPHLKQHLVISKPFNSSALSRISKGGA